MVASRALAAPGFLDHSFGASGKTVADFGDSDVANAVALQPDGKIVVAGYTTAGTGGTHDFALARINPDGFFDTTFGAGGKSLADFGGGDEAKAVALQPDGKIIVTGYTTAGTSGSN